MHYRATTTNRLPSTRIRRRRLRFSPSRLRQRFRGCSQAIFLTVWILVGLSTYGLVWVSFWYPTSNVGAGKNSVMSVVKEEPSFFFSALSSSKQTVQTSKKHVTKEKTETSRRLRKQTSVKLRKSMEEAEEEFTTIGFWIIFILWGYQKVKEWFPVSVSNVTDRRRSSRSRSSMNSPSSHSQTTTLQVRRIHREVIVRTLRRINQERQERDEELISVEAIEAFQNALFQDQEVWEGQQQQPGNRRTRGSTREEIDACTKRLPNKHDDGECIICLSELASDDKKEMLRVLPCNHGFHACCIDKWLQKSTQCPICKGSIRNEGI